MKRYGLLIVDDEKDILRTLSLTFEEEYNVFTTSTGMEALKILEQEDIALILADQRMPEMSGVEFLERTIERHPEIIRMILTGYTDTEALIQAINVGRIYRYIQKPWDRQELKITVKRALECYALTLENQRLIKELEAANERLKDENAYLKQTIDKAVQFDGVIGRSAAMKRVLDLVQKVTNTPVTVLLTGETGTGKSLLAHYIHAHSPRKDKLFIVQNCGALPEALFESEIFGHKRGAFTGAMADKKGLFEVADGGTLFLDEVSEMSPTMQVKFLQVLQEGKFRRVGDSAYRAVDVRIIAATNKDLEAEVKKRNFRADLYYRLNVFPIRLPPLRERLEDIPPLAEHCLKKHRDKMNRAVIGFTEEAMEYLCEYDYPGNVRELENVIERALILSTGDRIEAGEWLPGLRVSPAERELSKLRQLERDHILERLQARQGNLGLVAKDLEISRTTLWRRIKEYQIEPPGNEGADVSE
jgi:two-component system, NtrC family, response regulator HupR/HoxA